MGVAIVPETVAPAVVMEATEEDVVKVDAVGLGAVLQLAPSFGAFGPVAFTTNFAWGFVWLNCDAGIVNKSFEVLPKKYKLPSLSAYEAPKASDDCGHPVLEDPSL